MNTYLSSINDKLSNEKGKVLNEMDAWFKNCLGCVAGRKEFLLGRYMIVCCHHDNSIQNAFAEFTGKLVSGEKSACLMIFPDQPANGYPPKKTVLHRVNELGRYMENLSERSAEELINAGNLNFSFELTCPVTGVPTLFDDFEAIAFCPEAENREDVLYDPLMASPVPCVNISSDIYAFALFTRDLCLHHFGRNVFDLTQDNRQNLFQRAQNLWQRMAEKTIKNYIKITDTNLCPTYLSQDRTHWFANHQDPAFAETRKEVYRHEMPVIYTPKIIQAWNEFFEKGEQPVLQGLAQPGAFSQI